jgi:hypothetical protein
MLRSWCEASHRGHVRAAIAGHCASGARWRGLAERVEGCLREAWGTPGAGAYAARARDPGRAELLDPLALACVAAPDAGQGASAHERWFASWGFERLLESGGAVDAGCDAPLDPGAPPLADVAGRALAHVRASREFRDARCTCCAPSDALPARIAEPEDPWALPAVPGCPLGIGRLAVDTRVSEREGSLVLRLVPAKRDFAHCFELEALDLVLPGGAEIPGRRLGDDLPFTLQSGPQPPARPNQTPDRGLGLGVAIRLGEDDAARSSEEFWFELGAAAGAGRAGWVWRGTARDRCSAAEIPLHIPVDRLASCTGD